MLFYYWIYYTRCEKDIKCSTSLAFYLFSLTRLTNSIKHEHSCKILYLLHVSVLKTGFGWGCTTSWSLLMLFLFKAVPVPGGNISLPLYESTESCESLLKVEWQPDLSPQQIFAAFISVCKLTSCDVESLTGLLSSCVLAVIYCVVPWWPKFVFYRFWW